MYKKILLPLDGSELSECALEHAKALVKGCHVSEVVLLRVVEVKAWEKRPGAYSWGGVAAAEQINVLTRHLQEEAVLYLTELAAQLTSEGIQTAICVKPGEPASIILEYASKNQVDLIVMSTHGRSGLSRWALGSVAEKVTRNSTVPVLIASPISYQAKKRATAASPN